MTIRDLSKFFDETLEYPLPSKAHPAPDVKTYIVKSPDGKTGAWLASMADLGTQTALAALEVTLAENEEAAEAARKRVEAAQEAVASLRLDDEAEKNLYQRVVGEDVWSEMLNDGVPWLLMQRVGQDAYLCFAISQDAADQQLREAVGKSLRAVAEMDLPPATPAKKAAARKPRPGTSGSQRRSAGSKSSRGTSSTQGRTRQTQSATRSTGRSTSSKAAATAAAS